MIALAGRAVAVGVGGTLATLYSARGSSYRPLGSMMVGVPGMHAGGISGGCLDEYVSRQGHLATRDRGAVLLRFRTDPDTDGDGPVPGCGGDLEILVERLTPDHVALLVDMAAALESDEPSQLACTIERSGASISIERTWVRAGDIPPGTAPQLARICRDVGLQGRSRHAPLSVTASALVQHVPALTRLIIFGAGDDVRPVCDLAHSLGWHVAVVDRRRRLATRSRFPNADAIVALDWEEAIETLRFTPRTAAVLMTHSLDDDARVLTLLPSELLAYIGALGPAHRRQWLMEEVAAHGLRSAERVAALVRGPIGLDLGDRSAAGIAVSVVAEILASLNDRDARPLESDSRRPAAGVRPKACLV